MRVNRTDKRRDDVTKKKKKKKRLIRGRKGE